MLRLRLSPKARQDLDLIWDYTFKTWGDEQAAGYLTTLDASMQLLRNNPLLGADIAAIREGYRKFPSASHIMFYRVTADAIEIMRILHKNMDAERHL